MSEPLADTTRSDTTSTFLLDGEPPRLGGTTSDGSANPVPTPPTTATLPAPTFAAPSASEPAAQVPPPPSRSSGPSPVLSAPGSPPFLGSLAVPNLAPIPTGVQQPAPPTVDPTASVDESVPAPELPMLPTAAQVSPGPAPTPTTTAPTTPVADAGVEPPAATPATPTPATPSSDAHPMAHLMPQKTAPSEASKRAADIRAAKKAKARRIKIVVAIVAIAVAAIVGPPLGRWFVDALNDAGSTSTDVDD